MTKARPYDDLAASVERGNDKPTRDRRSKLRGFEHLRFSFTVRLSSWTQMVGALLTQLEQDAGSIGRGLSLLGTPNMLMPAWLASVEAGMDASARWLAGQPKEDLPDTRLRIIRVQRGETYDDLAQSARSFRLRGDGQLDAARLRPRYTLELRRSWLRMVGELLSEVLADAGSLERAATTLCVPEHQLSRWTQWFVSRGAWESVYHDWPLASVEDIDSAEPYADLAAAVLRGGLPADDSDLASAPPAAELRKLYRGKRATWDQMTGDLLTQIAADAGSARKGAEAISMPRSTFNAKLRRHEERRRRDQG